VLDVVLPALNEAAALPPLLRAFPDGYRAIVVDNGSTDGTPDVARAHHATVVTEPRPGYGAAVHTGVENATSDIVVVMDADGSLDPGALPALVKVVADGDADLVMGRRRPTSAAAWPWHARWGNRVLAFQLNRKLGTTLSDIGPVRVFRRESYLALGSEDRRFGYPFETVVRAANAGWRIREVDVDYRPRAEGTTSKVSGSARGTYRAVRDFYRVLP
jgi:glycosyltransferase involved in cell wall biosynthesis